MIHSLVYWISAAVFIFSAVLFFHFVLKRAYSYNSPNLPSEINPIGKEWGSFGVIEGDEARECTDQFKGSYSIYYRCGVGVFPKHWHPNAETAVVMQGRIRVKDYWGWKYYNQGDTYKFEKGRKNSHQVEFLEDENVLFLQFTPPFENGWSAKDH